MSTQMLALSRPKTLPSGRQKREPRGGIGGPVRRRSGLAKAVAEDLLDWLEAHGRRCHVSYVDGEGFQVWE